MTILSFRPPSFRLLSGRPDLGPVIGRLTAATLLALIAPVLAANSSLARETVPTRTVVVDVEKIATGLDHPWSVEPMPDGGLLVSERSGALRVVRDGVVSEPVAGMPEISVGGQGGLLDIALARDFEDSRLLFMSYSAPGDGGSGTAIARAVLSDDGQSLTEVKEIFRMNRFTEDRQHFGSRIAVASDGTLFFTIGDRGQSERAQDMEDHAGAVLRINIDGSIPADNPHAADGGALPEIWSKGHRNPQGADIDRVTGRLYAVEHGARGGDEFNLPEPGKNYGWPQISYGRHYSGAEIGVGAAADGYEQPVYYWDPSIAPGGMVVYRGLMFPEWDGDLLVAALKFQMLVRLDLDPDTGEILGEERLFKGDYGRMRDVQVAPDGSVLMVTDESDGAVIRITRTPLASE